MRRKKRNAAYMIVYNIKSHKDLEHILMSMNTSECVHQNVFIRMCIDFISSRNPYKNKYIQTTCKAPSINPYTDSTFRNCKVVTCDRCMRYSSTLYIVLSVYGLIEGALHHSGWFGGVFLVI